MSKRYGKVVMAVFGAVFLVGSLAAASTANPLAVSNATSHLTITSNPAYTDSVFPTVTQSFFDPSTINPKAFSYQMADYDAPRNRVIFYPYGDDSAPNGTSGALLFYNVGGTFTDPTSWTTVDLTQVLNNPNAVNFGGGFLDTDGAYAYLAASFVNPNPVAVKIDLAAEYADPGDPSAYEVFEPGAPGALSCSSHKIGGFSGLFAGGFAYFDPGGGIALRYDSTKPFASASSWQCFDLTTINDPNASKAYSMQSMAYVPPYVYYIPFANGLFTNNPNPTTASVLVRYDTTKDFTSASSYQVFDLATLGASLGAPADVAAQFNGFTGAVVVGTRLVLVPWGLHFDNPEVHITNSVALIYDTTRPLSDPGAWQYMDLRTVDPNAGGYQMGWLDSNGFVWFVPTHNYNDPTGIPPFICWNSNLPFTSISAWHTYPNSRNIWSTGAAYDPATNTAWFAPWGAPPGSGGPAPGLLTQFQISGEAPGAPTGVEATAGNAQATVSFTPPASDGGSPILSYTATSSPGGITASGTASPITVSGLANGTAFTFTVTATNAAGTGPASAPSNSVTPTASGVNGVCGSANGGTFTSAPTSNLCSSGAASSITGSGPWYWTCQGANGGTTANCSANLQQTAGNDKLLWMSSSKAASIWTLDGSDNYLSSKVYGPFSGWTPVSYTIESNGTAKLLWSRSGGAASIWTLDSSDNYITSKVYGPFSGWSPLTYASNPSDGTARLIWAGTGGSVSIWRLDASDNYVNSQVYGPYSGWKPTTYVFNTTSGTGRLVWAGTGGSASIWKLDASDNYISSQVYGPYSGWKPIAYTFNSTDGTSILTWASTAGQASIWKFDSTENYLGNYLYGPYSGWTPLTCGFNSADGTPRLIWSGTGGMASIWSLDSSGNYSGSTVFGPFSGWMPIVYW